MNEQALLRELELMGHLVVGSECDLTIGFCNTEQVSSSADIIEL
jgi:hypothetical protein